MHRDSRARDSFEDTSICVPRAVDPYVEVDPLVHPRSTMQHEYTGDDMSMPEHTVVSDRSQRHVEMYGGIQRGVLPCREETHLGEHADATPLQQHIVMREHLHCINSCMGDEGWRLVDHQPKGLLPGGLGFNDDYKRVFIMYRWMSFGRIFGIDQSM
jgi:hypothetical protein